MGGIGLNVSRHLLSRLNKLCLIPPAVSGPGADPLKLIEDLAKRKKIKTLVVSMGQGQEIIARRYMAAAAADGQWVLLQNTHLSLAYLSEARAPLAQDGMLGYTRSPLKHNCRYTEALKVE